MVASLTVLSRLFSIPSRGQRGPSNAFVAEYRKGNSIMHYRALGRTGWKVSEISFGAWAIGGTWGTVDDRESLAALHRAIDLGVNFIDTADVYGDGHSERLVGKLRRERSERIIVATKAGRRLSPHTA